MEKEADLDMKNNSINISSKLEFEEKLRSSQGPHLLIENKNEDVDHFLIIALDALTIGLATCHHGIEVQFDLIQKNKAVIIGHDKEILCCSTLEPIILWRVTLDFCFYEFRIQEEAQTIFVIDEVSIIAINFSGETLWHWPSPDIIKDFHFLDGRIKVNTIEDGKFYIDLHTGKKSHLIEND